MNGLNQLLKRKKVKSILPFSAIVNVKNPSEIFSYEFNDLKAMLEATIGVLNLCDGRISSIHRRPQTLD